MILSAGEALFDMIGTARNGGQVFEPVVGGSTLNVALGLARLGRPVTYLTRLSTDYFGEELAGFLTREGIDQRYVLRAPGEQTTMAFVALGPGGHPTYCFYTANTADCGMRPEHVPASLPDDINALHFGSFSLALEPVGSTLHGFMKAHAATRVIALDPNVRASLIADKAAWMARIDDMKAHADIIKASSEDLEWMEGGPVDIHAVARRWSMEGPHVAFVTDGGNGAVVAIAGESVFVPARAVTLIDTVGAGDTFQASILARLDEEGLLTKATIRTLDLATAAGITRFAVTAASITCSRRGADLPRRAEVDAVLATLS